MHIYKLARAWLNAGKTVYKIGFYIIGGYPKKDGLEKGSEEMAVMAMEK